MNKERLTKLIVPTSLAIALGGFGVYKATEERVAVADSIEDIEDYVAIGTLPTAVSTEQTQVDCEDIGHHENSLHYQNTAADEAFIEAHRQVQQEICTSIAQANMLFVEIYQDESNPNVFARSELQSPHSESYTYEIYSLGGIHISFEYLTDPTTNEVDLSLVNRIEFSSEAENIQFTINSTGGRMTIGERGIYVERDEGFGWQLNVYGQGTPGIELNTRSDGVESVEDLQTVAETLFGYMPALNDKLLVLRNN